MKHPLFPRSKRVGDFVRRWREILSSPSFECCSSLLSIAPPPTPRLFPDLTLKKKKAALIPVFFFFFFRGRVRSVYTCACLAEEISMSQIMIQDARWQMPQIMRSLSLSFPLHPSLVSQPSLLLTPSLLLCRPSPSPTSHNMSPFSPLMSPTPNNSLLSLSSS